MTTIERDLAKLYNLLCAAHASWQASAPDDETVSDEAWSRENTEKQRIYTEMLEVFHRYPGVLYHDAKRVNPVARDDWEKWTDEQRLEFLAELECCRWCGSLDTRCQCSNDE